MANKLLLDNDLASVYDTFRPHRPKEGIPQGAGMEGRRILESWKEISDYLKRSIKTCQRWEIEQELPIHRLDGTPSARVFAYPDELDRWMGEKLNHIGREAELAAHSQRHKKKSLVIAAAAVIAVAVVVSVFMRYIFQPRIVFPFDVPFVVVLPFENITGDEILDTWKTALPRLISIDLIQSRAVGSWPTGYVLQLLNGLKLSELQKYSGEDLKKISQKLNADYLATGSLIRSGEDIILNLSLHDSGTAGVIHSLRTMCPDEKSIFHMVDNLTREIKLAMNIPTRLVAHDNDQEIGRITTTSPEAFRLFWQGERLMAEGNIAEANQAFGRAAEIDPGFGEAFLNMYWAARHANAKEEVLKLGGKVFERIDRLHLGSRCAFEADYYRAVQRNLAKCMAAWEKNYKLLMDENAGHWLADVFIALEEFDKAIPILETLITRNPKNPDYIGHLSDCYATQGLFEKAEKTIDGYLSREGATVAELLWTRSNIALAQKKFDVALSFLDRLHSAYPRSMYAVKYSNGTVFLTQDDFAKAEKDFQVIAEQGIREQRTFGHRALMGSYLTQGRIEEAIIQARLAVEAAKSQGFATFEKESHYYLAYLHRISGNLPMALEEIEHACRNYEEEGHTAVRQLQLRALIILEMNRKEEFEKQLAEIKRIIEQEQFPKLMRAYYHLLGLRELRENHLESAINHFWKAVSILPPEIGRAQADADSAQYLYSLAEAYRMAGSCLRALETYRKIPPYWDLRFGSGDIYVRSFYRIAQMHDLCGRWPGMASKPVAIEKEMAIQNYRKFLSLWKDADPVFAAEVEDARRRLAALEAK